MIIKIDPILDVLFLTHYQFADVALSNGTLHTSLRVRKDNMQFVNISFRFRVNISDARDVLMMTCASRQALIWFLLSCH